MYVIIPVLNPVTKKVSERNILDNLCKLPVRYLHSLVKFSLIETLQLFNFPFFSQVSYTGFKWLVVFVYFKKCLWCKPCFYQNAFLCYLTCTYIPRLVSDAIEGPQSCFPLGLEMWPRQGRLWSTLMLNEIASGQPVNAPIIKC